MCDHSFVYSIRSVIILSCYFVMISSSTAAAAAAVAAAAASSNTTGDLAAELWPDCVFREGSQEIDCRCKEAPSELLPVITFPVAAGDALRQVGQGSFVASLKVHSCDHLNLQLDLTAVAHEFFRLRIEDIRETVAIGLVLLRPNDNVDIWLRRAGEQHLRLSGHIDCPSCSVNSSDPASVTLHIVGSGHVDIESLTVKDVRFRLKIRTAKSLSITDSYLTNLTSSAIEIFDVSNVNVLHSEFHQVLEEDAVSDDMKAAVMVLDRTVTQATIKDSLMKRKWLRIMSPLSTNLSWICTTSPDLEQDVNEDEASDCTGFGRFSRSSGEGRGAESTGAILIAVVSAALLLVAATALFLMNKRGTLERYL